jgi:membrane-associated protease RseP (regulator of RpoE activity)
MDRAFRDMDRRMEELQRRFEDLRGGFRFEIGPGLPGARIERHAIMDRDGERIEARQEAGGKITVKVGTKGADGKTTEETFEAKDMEALAKEHPEIAEKVKPLIGDGAGLLEFDRLPGGRFLPRAPRPALGVTVSEVPPVLRTQLSVGEGEGVVVEEVLPDTPAARLGLRRHDVILSVNGIPVSSAAGIRSALGAVKEGGALTLRILRGGKAEEVSGTR